MIYNAGDFPTSATVIIPINTFDSNDPTASVTATNLVNTDVHIHKDGGTTQRNNAAGITMTIDFDSITGNHLLIIDTSNNTVADFYQAGHEYQVRVEGVTVDGATINAWVGTFSIERSGGALALIKNGTYGLSALNALLAHADYGLAKLVRSTTPANTLTVGATGLVAVPDTQKVDLETIKTKAVTCGANVTIRADVGHAGVPGAENGAPYVAAGGAKIAQTVDLTAGQSIACSDKTGFSLSATGADLILKNSTFIGAIVAAINEFATYGLTALNTLLVTTGIKAASIPAATLAANQDVRNVSGTLPDVTLAASQPNYAPATASALDAVDNFVDTEVAAIKAVTDKLDTAVVLDGAVYKFTANALEEAPTGGSAPTAAAIRQEIDSNSTQLAAIVADTNELQTDLVNGGRLDLLIDGIKAKTDNLPSDPADESAIEAAITAATSPLAKPGDKMDIVDVPNATAVTAIQNGLSKPATAQTITPPTDMALNSTVMKAADYTAPPTVDQIHDEVVEGTLTFRKIMKILLSFAAGKSTGGGTATISFNDNADTKARITATTDENGNRTAVTLDGD